MDGSNRYGRINLLDWNVVDKIRAQLGGYMLILFYALEGTIESSTIVTKFPSPGNDFPQIPHPLENIYQKTAYFY